MPTYTRWSVLLLGLVLLLGCTKKDDSTPVAEGTTEAPTTKQTTMRTEPKPPDPPQPPPMPPKPKESSAKHQATLAALNKLGAAAHDVNAAAVVDLSAARDLDAALKLLGDLDEVSSVKIGEQGTDAHLALFAKLPGIKRLAFPFNKNLTDKGLLVLKTLTGLEALDIGYAEKITVAGVAHLAGLTELRGLNLSGIALGKLGIKHLANMRKLTHLTLQSCELEDEGLATLGRMGGMIALDLNRNFDIEGPGIHNLGGMTQCEELDLSFTHANDTSLRYLARLVNLKTLRLGNTDVTDEGLEPLAKMKKLERLELHETGVTDMGLIHVKGLTLLTYLNLPKGVTGMPVANLTPLVKLETLVVTARFDDKTADELKKVIPKLKIEKATP